jgi:hypothetical protein
MATKDVEGADGLAAHKTADLSGPEHHDPQRIDVFDEHRRPVSVPVVPAGPGADDRTPTIPRKREHVWSEVHDPFDTTSAEVDPRSSGDPIGTPRDIVGPGKQSTQ